MGLLLGGRDLVLVGQVPDVKIRSGVVAVGNGPAAFQDQGVQSRPAKFHRCPTPTDAGADDDGIVGVCFHSLHPAKIRPGPPAVRRLEVAVGTGQVVVGFGLGEAGGGGVPVQGPVGKATGDDAQQDDLRQASRVAEGGGGLPLA